MDRTGLLLFIPAYRCAPQITRVLSQLTPPIRSQFREIIVVDNISPDETVESAKNFIIPLAPHETAIRIVQNPRNMGLGGTHKMAFDYAIKNHFHGCIVLHGDDQGNILDFEPILNSLKSESSFVFGARFHPCSQIQGYSAFRIFGNQVFNLLASFATHRKILDFGGSGLNFFPCETLAKHDFWSYADDLTFHVFLVLNALKMNQIIEFKAITWREDDQISNVRLFKQARKLVRILALSLTNGLLRDSESKFTQKPAEWTRLLG
jgi:dolichol-phosphate mannosyltransferase